MDWDVVFKLLKATYWGENLRREVFDSYVQHSLCFGLFDSATQIGFARLITDYTTFAYLADVIIVEPYRGKGLGVWLVSSILAHPQLQGLRRWMLATRDAHGLYAKLGFTPLAEPSRYMEIYRPNSTKQLIHQKDNE